MNDLISRQDAIDALSKHEEKPKVLESDYDFGRQSMLDACLNDIEDLPSAQPEQQWIPCSKRLPEEKGEYLVTYHPCYWDNVSSELKVGIDSFRGKTTWAKKKYQRVIAWMQLPTCYQGDEK